MEKEDADGGAQDQHHAEEGEEHGEQQEEDDEDDPELDALKRKVKQMQEEAEGTHSSVQESVILFVSVVC
jgi:hypothetical protein